MASSRGFSGAAPAGPVRDVQSSSTASVTPERVVIACLTLLSNEEPRPQINEPRPFRDMAARC